MSQHLSTAIAVIGIDIGKNSFHIVGLDARDRSKFITRRPIALTSQWLSDPTA